jgi:hypothetical protein
MGHFISFITVLLRLLKKAWLFIWHRNPCIVYFRAKCPISINDLPLVIEWKIKNASSAEIEGLGPVKAKGSRILNNYKAHGHLTLVAYGWGNSATREMLQLNHQRFSFQPYIAHAHDTAGFDHFHNKVAASLNDMHAECMKMQGNVSDFLQKKEQIISHLSYHIPLPPFIYINDSIVKRKIESLEKEQQRYLQEHYQIQNPENFSSNNLYQ